AEFQLLAPLGLQVRVPVGAGHERGLVLVADLRVVETRRIDRPGLLARGAPRHAEPELIEESERPERLFVDRPRGAQLRVDRGVELRAEGAVRVRADRAGDEDTVAPPDLLLDVDAGRGVLREALPAVPHRAARDGRDRER